MSYPNAYCVKCGTHTDTLQKHTVVLQNNARALKGVCPTCETQVYKILPKGKDFGTKVPMTAEEKKKYPDAYCVKCKEHTPTKNAHTVVFENMSRAVNGSCGKCGSEVYRILGSKDGKKIVEAIEQGQAGEKRLATVSHLPVRASRRRDDDKKARMQWAYLVAGCMIMGIMAAFFMYSFL
jgi:Zn finger protein HypA/HybF involved in hydrogenase expression